MSDNPKNTTLIHDAQKRKPDHAHLLKQNQPEIQQEYVDDYDKIQMAVLETKRGRWFLGEYARRNKVVESQLVIDALAKVEAKISEKSTILESVVDKPSTSALESPTPDFNSTQQATQFGQLFGLFKQKSLQSLRWAGIKTTIPFSKIQTVISFATQQSSVSLLKQKNSLLDIVTDLNDQNVDKKLVNKLEYIASELSKLENLQNNLNNQLSEGIKFIGELENIDNNTTPDFNKFTPKATDTSRDDAEIELEAAKNELKTVKQTLNTIKTELETVNNKQENDKNKADGENLGPAGRIKKMFKIEQTFNEQKLENLSEPAQAFDDAFANDKLAVNNERRRIVANTRQISNPNNIEKDIQPQPNKQLSEQNKKLANLGNLMKNTGENKLNDVNIVDQDVGEISANPNIIVEREFNPLNALALLSKTERTMLFTLQN